MAGPWSVWALNSYVLSPPRVCSVHDSHPIYARCPYRPQLARTAVDLCQNLQAAHGAVSTHPGARCAAQGRRCRRQCFWKETTKASALFGEQFPHVSSVLIFFTIGFLEAYQLSFFQGAMCFASVSWCVCQSLRSTCLSE